MLILPTNVQIGALHHIGGIAGTVSPPAHEHLRTTESIGAPHAQRSIAASACLFTHRLQSRLPHIGTAAPLVPLLQLSPQRYIPHPCVHVPLSRLLPAVCLLSAHPPCALRALLQHLPVATAVHHPVLPTVGVLSHAASIVPLLHLCTAVQWLSIDRVGLVHPIGSDVPIVTMRYHPAHSSLSDIAPAVCIVSLSRIGHLSCPPGGLTRLSLPTLCGIVRFAAYVQVVRPSVAIYRFTKRYCPSRFRPHNGLPRGSTRTVPGPRNCIQNAPRCGRRGRGG